MGRKAWFYRQLLSYMPVFFIVISFVFFVFFQMLGEQSRQGAIQANETMIQQAMRSVDNSLKAIDQMLVQELLFNPDMSGFFNQEDQDNIYLNMQAVKAMKQFKVSNPLVDSMVLVRTQDEFVLSTSSSFRLQDYADYDFLQPYLSQINSEAKWSALRNYREFSFNSMQQVVTLVRDAPFVTHGKGLIAVNIKVDAIHNMIQGMVNPEVSFIHVKDTWGRSIIAGTSGAENGELVSQAVSPYSGWVYEGGLTQGRVVGIVSQLYNVWFIIGLLMCMAGVVWIVFVTRRNYKPIEAIVSRISKYSQTKTSVLLHGGKQDEFAFIESALESLLEQASSFQQQHREDLLMRKAYLFQQLMEGQYPSHLEQWNEQREAMGLPDLSQSQIVNVIEIDKYPLFCEQYPQQDQYLIKFALKSVVQEIAAGQETMLWTEWISASKLGVLAAAEDQDPNRHVATMLEQARQWVEEHLKLTITVGIGEKAERYTDIPESYEQARAALKFKMILGDNRIIHYAEVSGEDRGNAFDFLNLIRSMAQSFRLVNKDWQEKYSTLIHNIEQNMLDRDGVVNLADYMMYSLGREISCMAKEFQELWLTEGQPALRNALQSSDTLEELEQELGEALSALYDSILALMEGRNHADTIQKVRLFMEQNSSNPDLSLNYLSERFGMNWKTLSKLFREETGQKFVDYLIELRMNHARRLLEETLLPVQDIATEVGYSNAISFGRMFKKLMGMSPGDYREQAAIQQQKFGN
ncbi:helix-turn-helix domain-containing protein [Paenibacillus lautus]|uniref:helix-turn-helix domain-containing protein n=1 Tax=Paenibacillus lautus TaxID=1401 RepID=UPI0010CE6FB0|nr:AraC family transcriptional regulator [Actinobacillus pleuropneumoniae]